MTRPEPYKLRDGQPVFGEHWHAQAIALAEVLIDEGKIDGAAWAETLGAMRAKQAAEGVPDGDDAYYSAVLQALEALLGSSGAAPAEAVTRREADWRQAYLTTPHGQPVNLKD